MGSTAALLISTWASHGEQQDQPLGLGGAVHSRLGGRRAHALAAPCCRIGQAHPGAGCLADACPDPASGSHSWVRGDEVDQGGGRAWDGVHGTRSPRMDDGRCLTPLQMSPLVGCVALG